METSNYLGTEKIGKLLGKFCIPCIASLIISCLYNPRYAMGAMIVGALINIVGDPVAIFVLDMGIKGAAYATILGQFVSFLICALYLAKSRTFRLKAESFRIDLKQLKQIMALGISSLLTQLSIVVITVVNNILLVKYGAVSAYGEDIPLAAFVVIMKLFQIVLNIAIGIAAGAQPIVGYNYGARKLDRVRELLKAVLKWTAIVGIVCMFLFEVFPGAFIQLFGSDGELYLEFAVKCLRIYLLLILFTCVQKVCAIFLQSIGRAQAAPLAILRDLLLIVCSILMPVALGVTGIFWAAPIVDVIAMAITVAVMLKLWKELQGEAVPDHQAVEGHIQPSRPGVIVTISREHGSAGKRIGQILAGMLQVPCYYKEVTALAAQESGLAAEFISDINKNSPERLHELYMSTTIVQQAVVAQDRIIKKIAENGSCVIIGRAADYVLREHGDVVRIFIHAPREYRVRKVMEMYGDTDVEARKNISHSDAARSSYYLSITGLPWAHSDNYDLCIDSSIGEQACAEMILEYIRKKGY